VLAFVPGAGNTLNYLYSEASAASLGVLSCKVTGNPSFLHAVSPPSRSQTFEMPLFCKAMATRALVNSPADEQYRTVSRFSGVTTRNRLRRPDGRLFICSFCSLLPELLQCVSHKIPAFCRSGSPVRFLMYSGNVSAKLKCPNSLPKVRRTRTETGRASR
jgi:hypothetical protein